MGTGRQSYIDSLEVGTLVAFKLYSNDAKMYSGKVTKIGQTKVEVCTKNGKRYFIEKRNIYWVNTNGRWPAFVMSAFRGVDIAPEQTKEETEPIPLEPEENAPEVESEPYNGMNEQEEMLDSEDSNEVGDDNGEQAEEGWE